MSNTMLASIGECATIHPINYLNMLFNLN